MSTSSNLSPSHSAASLQPKKVGGMAAGRGWSRFNPTGQEFGLRDQFFFLSSISFLLTIPSAPSFNIGRNWCGTLLFPITVTVSYFIRCRLFSSDGHCGVSCKRCMTESNKFHSFGSVL